MKEDINNLGDDIKSIWKRLDTKYGDHTSENPSDILKMINTIEIAQRDLELTGREREINNSTIVSMIEERLPTDVENEWINGITGENREEISHDKFPYLLKLLLEIKQRIEYKGAEIRQGESRGKTYLVQIC